MILRRNFYISFIPILIFFSCFTLSSLDYRFINIKLYLK